MKPDEEQIQIQVKNDGVTSTLFVVKFSDNHFKMMENDIFNFELTFGTEFNTKVDEEGIHEIIQITKKSSFLTKRFYLTSQFSESEYRLLGDEIINNGGFWQVDIFNMATVNLPIDCGINLDEIFKIFNFQPTEIFA